MSRATILMRQGSLGLLWVVLAGCDKLGSMGEAPPPVEEAAPVVQRPVPVVAPPAPVVAPPHDAAAMIAAFKALKPYEVNDAQLERLANMPSGHELLTELSFVGTRLSSSSLDYLEKFPALKLLDVSTLRMGDEDADLLKPLTALETLVLVPSGMNDDSLVHLKEMSNLREITFSGNAFSEGSLVTFFEDHPQLEVIRANDSASVTDRVMAAIGKLPKLRNLELRAGKFGDKGLEQLRGCEELERLVISSCNITGQGLKQVSKQLKELDVSKTGLGALGAAAIGQLRELRILRCMQLTSPITDKDMRFVGPLDNLEELYLSSNAGLGDGTMPIVAGLKSLQILDVSDCRRVTNKGLEPLSKAKSKTLQKVVVRGTSINRLGLEEMQRRAPDVAVVITE